MASQPPGQTIQATALVHEAWLRLVGTDKSSWAGRRHFFRSAALAMQQILVEIARRKRAVRHGGDQVRVSLDQMEIPSTNDSEEFLLVQDALEHLEQEDRDMAEIVRLRYFIGLSKSDVAELLGLSVRTVERRWDYAKAWLCRELEQAEH
jgi:RNA polymerase sigma factor (TIGR02999 family)